MIDWQNIIALGLVSLAAGYLVRRAWRRVVGRTERACGNCAGCGATSTAASQPPTPSPLVRIESQYNGTYGHFDDTAG